MTVKVASVATSAAAAERVAAEVRVAVAAVEAAFGDRAGLTTAPAPRKDPQAADKSSTHEYVVPGLLDLSRIRPLDPLAPSFDSAQAAAMHGEDDPLRSIDCEHSEPVDRFPSELLNFESGVSIPLGDAGPAPGHFNKPDEKRSTG